jgi:hypothetical protein
MNDSFIHPVGSRRRNASALGTRHTLCATGTVSIAFAATTRANIAQLLVHQISFLSQRLEANKTAVKLNYFKGSNESEEWKQPCC